MSESDGEGGASTALKQAGLAAARALLKAGGAVGRAVKKGVDSVDPDVWTHAADLPLVALTMLTPKPGALAELEDDGRVPVLFVHGLGGHPGNFLPMRTYFRAMGRPRTHAVALPPDCTVEVLGGVLADTLEAAAARAPGQQVDVVAHSLGGLVARAALLEVERRGSAARVRTLVTLGTPHAGSHLARYANTVTTRDLRPGSPILARLEAQLPWKGPPSQPRLVAFWSRADVIILPAEKSLVDGAENHELPGLSHNGLLLSPMAWDAVYRAVDDGRGAPAERLPAPPR